MTTGFIYTGSTYATPDKQLTKKPSEKKENVKIIKFKKNDFRKHPK